MRKGIFLIFFLIIIGFLSYKFRTYFFIGRSFYQTQIKPPQIDIIKELTKKGKNLEQPLKVPDGFELGVFADLKEFGSPRVLAFDRNQTLFSSLTNSGKVLALPDKDNDGVVDQIKVILEGLDRPHGIAFSGEFLYVAETDKVTRYNYDPEELEVSNPTKLFDLPKGGRHFTRTIKVFGDKLYTSVGSSCDVCLEADEKRASILVSNLDGSDLKVFARGLRNTVFFVFDKEGKIWGNDMGRDFLGDNLPPDELNLIQEGKNYGWPWCYAERIRDSKFRKGEQPQICQTSEPMKFGYPAHVAPLGITFIKSKFFDSQDEKDLLVAFHGSWNSTKPVGYKVVRLDFEGDRVLAMEDFITGWLKDGNVIGRPVDLVFDAKGYLYISDDKTNLIYILTKKD